MSGRITIARGIGVILLSFFAVVAQAQMGFGTRPGSRELEEILPRFDADGDGKLDDGERRAAREYIKSRGLSRGAIYSSAIPRSSSDLESDLRASAASAARVGIDLYDESTLRTLYLRFAAADWYEELADFFGTGVDVPADLIADGRMYRSVGVRFRGNSSYQMTGGSLKKPFNVSIDFTDGNLRLYGYRTLNLLNASSDPSFIREVLYSRICREYLPAPKANFVKLVINGENWGIYVNVQQLNNDFLQEWFNTTAGVRWKVPANRGSDGALVYIGDDPAKYRGSFELRTSDSPEAWQNLIRLCDVLNRTPNDLFEAELNAVLDVDGALWYIALENVFIDGDGYLSRGSDYALYQDPGGRFHALPYDNNETFRYAGGGGPNSWPSSDPMLSPVAHEGNAARPLVSRLLAIPTLRARYLAHVRTIVEEWLSWDRIGPLVSAYRTLIEAEVKADDKKLYSYEAFAAGASDGGGGGESVGWRGGFGGRDGAPSLQRFVTERREFLQNHLEIKRPTATIESVSLHSEPAANQAVSVTARISGNTHRVDSVLLHYRPEFLMSFRSIGMYDDGAHSDGKAGDGVYGADIPPFPGATRVYYYVEARTVESLGTTAFQPARAERGALMYSVPQPKAVTSPVVINELMARNTRSLRDPQREYDDWIELHNITDGVVDLSGMYLTDKEDRPRKWRFPEGTVIPPRGYAIVWVDEDTTAGGGLHANFKLSASGETVLLVDTDERGNQILDRVRFGKQEEDVAFGRIPDGTGAFQPLRMTPGKRNEP